jgi:hypothetical protein
MKKLITLLLLFTITLFYSIPTQAYTLDANDIPIAELNGLTLNEVFDGTSLIESEQDLPILTQSEFDTNWQLGGSSAGVSKTYVVTENVLTMTHTTSVSSRNFRVFTPTILSTDKYYIHQKLNINMISNSVLNIIFQNRNNSVLVNDVTLETLTNNGGFQSYSYIVNPSGGNEFRVQYHDETGTSIGTSTIQLKDVYLFNITNLIDNNQYSPIYETTFDLMSDAEIQTQMDNWIIYPQYFIDYNTLGIDTLTQAEMEEYFQTWQINNAYIKGYNDGYDDGFDDGFDDGVASETSFAVGYALGLSQGADMETGSSLLILIVALIGFILMIIGFITKRGIFNLLSTGAFIVLGGLLVEFVGFIIIAIGLVLINIYYAFFGNV